MTTELTDALQDVLMSLILFTITTALPVLVVHGVRFLREKHQELQARVQETRTIADDLFLDAIQKFALLAVQYAEQAGLAGLIENEAKAKKAAALDRLQNLLIQRGWEGINVTTLDTAVEAAVLEGLRQAKTSIRPLIPAPLGSVVSAQTVALDELIETRCTSCPGDASCLTMICEIDE